MTNRDLRGMLLTPNPRRLRRDQLAEAIALFADPDQRLRRAAGQALIAAGADAVAAVSAALADQNPSVRQSAAFVLGELARTAPAPHAAAALVQALSDDDPKVRKNVAVALGKLADPASADALIEQLHAEPMHYVRPSIILSLGQIGGELVRGALEDYRPQTEEEARAARLALERNAPATNAILLDLPFRALLDIQCLDGVEAILLDELRELGQRGEPRPGMVRTHWDGALRDLLRSRCHASAVFPVRAPRFDGIPDPWDVAEIIAESEAIGYILALTERGDGPIHYRVHYEPPPRTSPRRSVWVEAFIDAFRPTQAEFVNSPSRYSWELIVSYRHGHWYVGARPTAYPDPRFDYRVADVPAAINPSLAAAMARVIGRAEGLVVLDPFCGSGTPLVEYDRLIPTAQLIGVDNDADALRAAERNLAAAGLAAKARLIEGDSRALERLLERHGTPAADVIITNLPYGVRVGSYDELLDLYPAWFAQAAGVLRGDGWMGFVAKDDALVRRCLRDSRLELVEAFPVNTGGIHVGLYLCRHDRGGARNDSGGRPRRQ
jgi:23S rRNA G2445 N2-methylase RlmL